MKKIYIWSMVLLSAIAEGYGGEALKTWNYQNLNDIRFYAASNNKARMFRAPEVKTDDGRDTLAVALQELHPDAKSWDVQLNFIDSRGFEAGQRYELAFFCKASVPGTMKIAVAQAEKPWHVLPGSTRDVAVSTEWQEVKLSFTAAQAWAPLMAAPRLMLAGYGSGATLYFGPVELRKSSKPLPFGLSADWHLFPRCPEPRNYADMPTGAASQMVQLKNNRLDLASLIPGFKEKDGALLFNSFNSPEAGTMMVGVSADWWLELYINGDRVYGNIPVGNLSHSFVPDDHVIAVPVKKGENLLAAKVMAGSKGWQFVCGTPNRGPDALAHYTVKPDPNWKPVLITKSNLVPQPGTALDLTALVASGKPCGARGRVVINSAGRLSMAENPDVPARFRGMNSWSCSWALRQATQEEIKAWAESIARRGYNMIRLQGVDLCLLGGVDQKRKWPQKTVDDVPYFDPAAIDKFDYLVSCLKANGVYFCMDLMSVANGYSRVNPPAADSFKIQLFFNPVHRAHWESAARHLLTRVNPYTGTCLKDEPTLAGLEPYNEQDLLIDRAAHMKQFTPRFREYLKKIYRSDEALRLAWKQPGLTFGTVPDIDEDILRKGDVGSHDAGNFLIETMAAMTDWYSGRIRGMGYSGLIMQWDMIMRTMEMPVRAKMPVIAQHTYFAHPSSVPTRNLVKKSSNSVFTGGDGVDSVIGQDSSLNSSYFRAAAAIRFLDRPFMVTEYSHSFPNRYRHERGLYFGSYAALQGWDSLHPHGDVVALWPAAWYGNNLPPLSSFEAMHDPVSYASEVVSALAWFRGDVKEASHTVGIRLSAQAMFPKNFLSAIGDDYAKLAMLTRIGIVYPEIKTNFPVASPRLNLELVPDEFSTLSVNQWYVSSSSKDGKVFPRLLDALRKRQILPESNKTDYSARVYQSETGEIVLNGRAETMTVITPRLEGAIIKKDIPVKLAQLEITSCSKPASVVLASLDRNQPLGQAKRLLLVFSTNALNSGMTFENPSMNLVAEVGAPPILMETARLTLKLKSAQKAAPAVYALNMDGTRAATIPVSFKDGILSLALDTSALKYATPFFEMVFP